MQSNVNYSKRKRKTSEKTKSSVGRIAGNDENFSRRSVQLIVGKVPSLTFRPEECILAANSGGGDHLVPWALSESDLRAVEDVLGFIRRKNRLTAEEWEDFHSWVWVRLAETDYRILRKFEHRGSLRKFLGVTLHRLLLDYRSSKWGKWRPSSLARSIGPDIEQLEFYLQREGHSPGEAVQLLTLNHRSMRSEEELERIAAELPVRRRWREQTNDSLEHVASAGPTPLDSFEKKETAAEEEQVMTAVEAALSRLPPEDRVIVRLRFEEGRKLNEVAAALGIKPEIFYRRFEKLLRTLRASLEDKGVSAACIERFFPEEPVARISDAVRLYT